MMKVSGPSLEISVARLDEIVHTIGRDHQAFKNSMKELETELRQEIKELKQEIIKLKYFQVKIMTALTVCTFLFSIGLKFFV